MTIYKIRNKNGLFSLGGTTPSFNKNGKIWKQKNHLNCHLTQVSKKGIYKDCEVICYEFVESAVSSDPVSDWLELCEQRKNDKNRDYEARIKFYKETQEIHLLKELQQKYPNIK